MMLRVNVHEAPQHYTVPGFIGMSRVDNILVDTGSTTVIVHPRLVPDDFQVQGRVNLQVLDEIRDCPITTIRMKVLDETMDVSAVVFPVPNLDAIVGTSAPGFKRLLLKGLASGALGEPDSSEFVSVLSHSVLASVVEETEGAGPRPHHRKSIRQQYQTCPPFMTTFS